MKPSYLLIVYWIGLSGILIYLKGFFPRNMDHLSYSSQEDIPPQPMTTDDLDKLNNDNAFTTLHGKNNVVGKGFTKLIFITVSSLRKDFLFGDAYKQSVPFLTTLIDEKKAVSFTSRAKPPTVTLPRVKALMTGNVPGFIDVVFNLETPTKLSYDSLIHSSFVSGKTMAFYGDEVWTHLFPGMFRRQDGCSFMFTPHIDTIDRNVTDNLLKELEFPDNFDSVFLHYQGLKLTGYFYGPHNGIVHKKLGEIDEVIRKAYEKLKNNENALIVLTSEFGMSDRGSHGGITDPEILLPLVFISPSFNDKIKIPKIDEVDQIDIAPTLALLLGLPIPKSSIGKAIVPVLESLRPNEELHRLQYNCHQLITQINTRSSAEAMFDVIDPHQTYREGLSAHSLFLNSENNDEMYEKAKLRYVRCQTVITSSLSQNMNIFNYAMISLGLAVLWLSYMGVVYIWGVSAVLSATPSISRGSPTSPITWGFLLTTGTVLHSLSLISTSFLEEEHQLWYYITATFLCVLLACVISEIASEQLAMDIPTNFYTTATIQNDNRMYTNTSHGTRLKNRGHQLVPQDGDIAVEFNDNDLKKLSSHVHPRTSKYVTIGTIVAGLTIHRVLRALNQTGVQNASATDVGEWLNRPDHIILLTLLVMVALVTIAMVTEVMCHASDNMRRIAMVTGLVFVYLFRTARGSISLKPMGTNATTSDGLVQAAIVYIIFLFLIGRAVYFKVIAGVGPKSDTINRNTMDCLKTAFVLLGSLLLRPHNIWGLTFNLLLYWLIFRLLWPVIGDDKPNAPIGKLVLRITLCYWFAQFSFFSMGNSNSISTIDVMSGYVGLSQTHVGIAEDMVIATLVGINTYISPILWTLFCFADVLHKYPKDENLFLAMLSTYAFLRLTPTALYFVTTFTQRQHLFVWSVFSPKLLYEAASTFVYGLLLTLIHFIR